MLVKFAMYFFFRTSKCCLIGNKENCVHRGVLMKLKMHIKWLELDATSSVCVVHSPQGWLPSYGKVKKHVVLVQTARLTNNTLHTMFTWTCAHDCSHVNKCVAYIRLTPEHTSSHHQSLYNPVNFSCMLCQAGVVCVLLISMDQHLSDRFLCFMYVLWVSVILSSWPQEHGNKPNCWTW